MSGTRPGGAIAAAWAAMMRLGVQGYTDLTSRAVMVANRLMDGVSKIPGCSSLGIRT
jgi:sphinganine-1-phosphate aldolase